MTTITTFFPVFVAFSSSSSSSSAGDSDGSDVFATTIMSHVALGTKTHDGCDGTIGIGGGFENGGRRGICPNS